MTINEALAYIRISVQEGYLALEKSEEILKLSVEEIIKFAEEEGAKGDDYVNAN